jgi:hypothetical protein
MFRLLMINPAFDSITRTTFQHKDFQFFSEAFQRFGDDCLYMKFAIIIADFENFHFVAVNKTTKASITLYKTEL